MKPYVQLQSLGNSLISICLLYIARVSKGKNVLTGLGKCWNLSSVLKNSKPVQSNKLNMLRNQQVSVPKKASVLKQRRLRTIKEDLK